jgi:aminopeptidase
LGESPAFEIARYQEMTDDGWAALWLVGEEYPGLLEAIDPRRMALQQAGLARMTRPYTQARHGNHIQWSIAAVPTPGWAARVYPELAAEAAVAELWRTILKMTRADLPDPVAAWHAHIAQLRSVSTFLQAQRIDAVRFFDPALGPDDRASTDLTVGLTPTSFWETAAFKTPSGLQFVANIPSEEVFTTPHRMRADGWVRTSRPIYPLDKEVRGAYFRFEQGECVEADAAVGAETLRAFLEIPGTRRLGEIALVDTRSPLTRTFFDILYDENAACHIAFGQSLGMCVSGIADQTKTERVAYGLNESDAHEDFMIGTPTMHVTGLRADGGTVEIMRDGQFVI